MRLTRALVAMGALLLCLGVANIIFGVVKVREYNQLITEPLSINKTATPEDLDLNLDNSPPVAIAPSGEALEQLKRRLEYYRFVISGGRWISAIAGIILLVALSRVTTQGKEHPEQDQGN